MARHFNLPTRLLDWTANALYSLYFACYEHHDNDGKLWAMLRRSDENYDIDAFELALCRTEQELFDYRASGGSPSEPSIKIVHPFYNTARVLAQDGAFTVQSRPTIPNEE
jgi:hypothetical protein